jgi:hypothetical protein
MTASLSGKEVTAEHDGLTYKIMVKEGVCEVGIPVVAKFNNDLWEVYLKGEKLTVIQVIKQRENDPNKNASHPFNLYESLMAGTR